MAINFNNTTPAAPAGSVNVTWQSDTSNNASAYVSSVGGVSTKTANYPVVAGDTGTLIQLNSTSSHTVTLLNPPPSSNWWVILKNIGTGVWTVSRNSLTIDGQSLNLSLGQGDSVLIYTDGTNYQTGFPRPFDLIVFAPGLGTNSQVLARFALVRTGIFPASAPNAVATASVASTGTATFTITKNGSSFATVTYTSSASGTFTQASDASFAPGDVFELIGPGVADATLSDVGITLQGYRF